MHILETFLKFLLKYLTSCLSSKIFHWMHAWHKIAVKPSLSPAALKIGFFILKVSIDCLFFVHVFCPSNLTVQILPLLFWCSTFPISYNNFYLSSIMYLHWFRSLVLYLLTSYCKSADLSPKRLQLLKLLLLFKLVQKTCTKNYPR